ncbi:MAG: alpha/beta hydrolase [Pseudomonadota bacterium]
MGKTYDARRLTLSLAAGLALVLTSVTAQAQTKTVLTESSDGVPIAVTIGGKPDGPELLFIHGYMSSSLNWIKQLESELAETHKLVALDMRGHGSSGKPWTRSSYASTQLFADDVAAAIDLAELTDVVIVTWSAGGLYALDYVRHYGGEKVAGIVLSSSVVGLLPAPPPATPTPEYQARIERSRSVNLPTIVEWTSGFIDFMGKDTELPAKEMEMLRTSAMLVPHHVRRFMRDRPLDNTDLVAELDLPLLFLAGDQHNSFTSGDLAKAAGQFANAELKTYAGLGSMVNWHAPARFNADVTTFAAKVQTGH